MNAAGQTIGLAMIVRDEAAIIRRCLESVAELIDNWVICDTGSTDPTPEIIEKTLAGVPGRLHRVSWTDFGHNRSQLMSLAQGTADYLLLIDADMTVQRGLPLPRLTADAYMLREQGSLDFGVLRLVRGDRRWWYEGSTHEYLCTDGQLAQQELDALTILHHGDGSSRSGKLLRDLALLKRDVASGRSTPRTVFYLAQTYRDLGRAEPAIEWYRRRVELGGWDEEVFYANLQEGMLRAQTDLGDPTAVLLEAWDRRPSRAEPLYELARLYRERGNAVAAHLFASRGLEIGYPSDVLFVHRWVYEWGLRVEKAVAAAALGNTAEALSDLAVVRDLPGVPDHVAAFVETRLENLDQRPDGRSVSRRRASAASRLAALAPSTRIGELKLDVRPSWPAFNPTIAPDGDGFRMIVRTANYRIGGGVVHDDGLLRNINYLVSLDSALAVMGIDPVLDCSEVVRRYSSGIQGYEDCRLVQVGDGWFATATACEFNPIDRREVVLLSLDGPVITDVRPLEGPKPGRHEKNWMPFVRDGILHVVYTCGPTVVLRCDVENGRTRTVGQHPGPPMADALRGGSQGVPLPDGSFLFVTHEVNRVPRPARYLHRFVRLGAGLTLDAVSEPFTFAADPVEFCAGLTRRGDELILSFGVSDAASGLAVVREEEVLALLRPPSATESK